MPLRVAQICIGQAAWTRAAANVSSTSAASLPIERMRSTTNRSISPAGIDLDGQVCQPRFWAAQQDHWAAALAVVDFLDTYQSGGATDAQGQVMAKATNVALRTLCLDALAISPPTDADAVREWIAEEIDEPTMMDELPRGPDEAAVEESEIEGVRKFLDELAERIQFGAVVRTGTRAAVVSS
jgi:hypothetical protein